MSGLNIDAFVDMRGDQPRARETTGEDGHRVTYDARRAAKITILLLDVRHGSRFWLDYSPDPKPFCFISIDSSIHLL